MLLRMSLVLLLTSNLTLKQPPHDSRFFSYSEYYSGQEHRCTVQEVNHYLRGLCERVGATFLQDDSIVCGNVRVCGGTLWTYIPKEQTVQVSKSTECVEYKLNDFRVCFTEKEKEEKKEEEDREEKDEGGTRLRKEERAKPEGKSDEKKTTKKEARPIEVSDTNMWHRKTVEVIQEAIGEARREKQNLLVLTHHSPTFQNLSNKQRPGKEYMKYSASSDLEHMFRGVHTWCHGHTHFNSRKKIRGTYVTSNQRGYKWEPSKNYACEYVVEVPGVRQEERGCILI